MFGVTPFAAYGVAEFSEATSGLRIDGGLVEESAEQPTHYLAVAGPDDGVELGYALVQIPVELQGQTPEGRDVRPAAGGVPAAADGSDVADPRRRLAEAEGKAEGVLRVSRAQTEEIEELRARLRRAGESRAELDQEVDRLRKALAEADESVLDLTRRTREEMAALASRITAAIACRWPTAVISAARSMRSISAALFVRRCSCRTDAGSTTAWGYPTPRRARRRTPSSACSTWSSLPRSRPSG
jgi:hypothetical protein